MSECDHVFRFYTNKAALMVCLNCGLELNADDISLRMEILKNAAKYMATQLAERDALIERLVEAGEVLDVMHDDSQFVDDVAKSRELWRALVAEYQAMKGGEG